MDAMICVFGVNAERFTKKEIQNVFNEVYHTDGFKPQFHCIWEYEGYVVFDVGEAYELEGFSHTDLSNYKNKHLPITPEKEVLYRDFFSKVNKPELFDEIDVFVYVCRDAINDEFYGKLLSKK
jgi:hypothetical protein